MKQRRRTSWIAAALLAGSLAASMATLHHLDQMRPQGTLEDVLYITSPTVLKRASLGYDGLLADIYWTRTVQYFGAHHRGGGQSYALLAPLLEITTHLDPHLLVAYQFGASFLAPEPPQGAGVPERAIQLMEYGIQNNPDDWRLYYSLGFVYYMEVKDYSNAAEVFARGSKVPGAHPFMKVLAAQLAQHAGEFATARMLWDATYQSTHDRQIRKNAIEHLRSLRVDEDVIHLQQAVTTFGQRTGRVPASMAELAESEGWRGIPVDPDGHPYRLTPDGRVEVSDPENFEFVTRGLPPGYKPTPTIP